jgi:hypothetical protein
VISRRAQYQLDHHGERGETHDGIAVAEIIKQRNDDNAAHAQGTVDRVISSGFAREIQERPSNPEDDDLNRSRTNEKRFRSQTKREPFAIA